MRRMGSRVSQQKVEAGKLSQRGQSLVEAALFFPIFVMLLAGLVEVSQLVITQNKVTSAARAGARFVSSGGENAGLSNVILRTVTQTLALESNVWDVWVVRATVNSSGNGFKSWELNHVYGDTVTQRYGSVSNAGVQARVLNELQRDEHNNVNTALAANLDVAGALVIHDVQSIIGLQAFLPGEVYSVGDLSIMRQASRGTVTTNGCDIFPIALGSGVRSVTPPGQGATPFPASFAYPTPAPVYNTFVNHVPDVTLSQAKEGTLFRFGQGSGSSNHDWLVWNNGIVSNAQTLANSLAWPGNARDYTNHGDAGAILPGFSYPIRGYAEPGDPSDVEMQINDWIQAGSGSLQDASVAAIIRQTIDRKRGLRLVIWQNTASGRYQIGQFAVFRVIGYGTSPNWLLLEFIRWDSSCGQVVNSP